MAHSRGDKFSVGVGGEPGIIDLLRKRLSPQNDALLLPLPNGEHVIREASNGAQFISRCGEGHVRIRLLGTFAEHAVNPETRVFVDNDGGITSAFSNCKEATAWMYTKRSNTSSIVPKDEFFFATLHIQQRDDAAVDECDSGSIKIVQIVPSGTFKATAGVKSKRVPRQF